MPKGLKKEARTEAAEEMYSTGASTDDSGVLGLIMGAAGAIAGGVATGGAGVGAGWTAGQKIGEGIQGAQEDDSAESLTKIGEGAATFTQMGADAAKEGDAPPTDDVPPAGEVTDVSAETDTPPAWQDWSSQEELDQLVLDEANLQAELDAIERKRQNRRLYGH